MPTCGVLDLQAMAITSVPDIGNQGNPHRAKLKTMAFGWQHLWTFVSLTQAVTIFYFPAAIASVVTFQHKLDKHKQLLEDLESYDIRSAKCAVEGDRALIEGHIADLFDGIEDPVISVPFVSGALQTEEPAELPEALSKEARLAIRYATGYSNQDQYD